MSRNVKEIKVTVFYVFHAEEGDENYFATETDAEKFIKYIERKTSVESYLYEVIEWQPASWDDRWDRVFPRHLVHKHQRVFGVTTPL